MSVSDDIGFFLLPCFQTLLNQQWLYAASVVPAYIILLISLALAFRMAGGSVARVKSCLSCSSLSRTGEESNNPAVVAAPVPPASH